MSLQNKESFRIAGLSGTKSLRGSVAVSGAKNAVLPIMAGALLIPGKTILHNVPVIDDVSRISEILRGLGAEVSQEGTTLTIDASGVSNSDLNNDISKRLRASVILTGPLLARMGSVSFPHPGGCVLGARPIDLFLENFQKMGVTVSEEEGRYVLSVNGALKAADLFLRIPSVTVTEAMMMAAIAAKGTSVIKNAAMEPEIVDLAAFLTKAGAKVRGAGTPTIEVDGTGMLSSTSEPYTVMPDRIEAGSFLILGSLLAEEIEITNCNPLHLEIVIDMLKQSGVPIETTPTSIIVRKNGSKPFSSFNVKTHEYPGFPTDLQAPITVFLTQCEGEALVHETIFEARLNYTQDLVRMGANITMFDPHRVLVKGPTPLKGKELEGPDIRAGLAFVIAALAAEGESVLSNVQLIDRGYAKIDERLRSLGARITRSSVCE